MRLTAIYESCTQRPAEEHTSSHAGPPEVVLGDEVNSQGQWEAGFVVTGGWGGPWLPREDVAGLLE